MLSNTRKRDLLVFAHSLGLEIKNLEILNTALTHSSFIKDLNLKVIESNERLEFFGDAILKMYVSEYLVDNYLDHEEGKLSKLRAYVVSEKVLAKIADKLNFKKYLSLGKSEHKSLPVSILADSLEALLAVIYYDCGSKKVNNFILKHWKEYITLADKDVEGYNYKAILQEYLQANKLGLPEYKTVSEKGPQHNKCFEVGVYLNNRELARGSGKTKKDASQLAAKSAIELLEKKSNY